MAIMRLLSTNSSHHNSAVSTRAWDQNLASVDKKVHAALDNLSKFLLVLLGLVLIAIIALIDYSTGPELSLAIFYLIPIAIGAWWGGFPHGILLSLAAVVAWYSVDLLWNPSLHSLHPGISIWNGVVRFGFFVITSSLLSRLRAAIRHEQSLARTDPLTGVANGRTFYERAHLEIERSGRTLRPFTLAYLDLDNFKEVNDALGHVAGDDLLHAVAATIRKNARASDLVARLGGDEFVILYPETDAVGAGALLLRLHESLVQTMSSKGMSTSCSIGAATFFRPPRDVDVMLHRVDALMYEIKRSGKGSIKHEIGQDGPKAIEGAAPLVERRAAVRVLCNRSARVTPNSGSTDQPRLVRVQDLSPRGIALHLDSRLARGTLLTIEPMHCSRVRTLLARVVRTTSASDGWLHGCELSNHLSDSDLHDWLTEGQ